jgi:hypothetical protein
LHVAAEHLLSCDVIDDMEDVLVDDAELHLELFDEFFHFLDVREQAFYCVVVAVIDAVQVVHRIVHIEIIPDRVALGSFELLLRRAKRSS